MRLALPVMLIVAVFASLFLVVLIGPGQQLLAPSEAVTIQKK
jgi:hypothetical protein